MNRPRSCTTVVASAAGLLFVGAILAGRSVAVAVLLALVVAATPRLIRGRRARALATARTRAFPAALELIVVATSAGLTPHQTIEVLARSGPCVLRPAFGDVVRRTQLGEPLADALSAVPMAVGPVAVAATDALALAQRHGSPLAVSVSVIADEAARQRRVASDAAARRLPVRLSFPLVVCVLPAFVLLAVAPAVLAALDSFHSPQW
ncbi:MAG: type II secretion system F family protein [Actinomycetota bacterium]